VNEDGIATAGVARAVDLASVESTLAMNGAVEQYRLQQLQCLQNPRSNHRCKHQSDSHERRQIRGQCAGSNGSCGTETPSPLIGESSEEGLLETNQQELLSGALAFEETMAHRLPRTGSF
jgi:hypothetical protein